MKKRRSAPNARQTSQSRPICRRATFPRASSAWLYYRRIAALRTAEQSQELLDELIDRYGEPPQPVLKLMDVALLRAEAVQIGVSDISQRGSEITFTFAASEAVPVEAVMALCSLPKNRRRLTLSATGTEPKLLLRLSLGEDALDTALTLVGDLRVNKEENEKEVTL